MAVSSDPCNGETLSPSLFAPQVIGYESTHWDHVIREDFFDGDELIEIVRRVPHHARRDFFEVRPAARETDAASFSPRPTRLSRPMYPPNGIGIKPSGTTLPPLSLRLPFLRPRPVDRRAAIPVGWLQAVAARAVPVSLPGDAAGEPARQLPIRGRVLPPKWLYLRERRVSPSPLRGPC